MFAGEIVIVYVLLESFQYLGYGGQPGHRQGPLIYLPLTLLMVALAMGAGEARFGLYRRVWSVAGLSDAMAIGLAVTEAALLITVANFLMPDGQRPLRLAAPILATPAMVIGVGLFRLLPRLLSRVPATSKRLLVVVQDSRGYATVKALAQHPDPEWKPVAIVTPQLHQENRTVLGIPVVDHVSAIERAMKDSQADGVAFVLDETPVSSVRDLIAICLKEQKPIFILQVAAQWFPKQREVPMRQLSADDLVGRRPLAILIRLFDHDGRARRHLGAKDEVGERVLDVTLDRPPQRTRAHGGIPALLDEHVLGLARELQLQLALCHRLAYAQ